MDAGKRLGWSVREVQGALGRLSRDKWLAHPRRGLYVYLDPFTKEQRAHPFVVGTRAASPSAVSHWSALQHWGLTEQLPDHVSISTSKDLRRPPENAAYGRTLWRLLDTSYEFIQVRPQRLFGIDQVRVGRWEVPIFDKERAILDTFLQPDYFGSISVGLEVVESRLAEIDLRKLVRYALKLGVGHTIKRLGWALDRAGVPSKTTEPLLKAPLSASTRVLLEPSGKRRGSLDPKWRVLMNQ